MILQFAGPEDSRNKFEILRTILTFRKTTGKWLHECAWCVCDCIFIHSMHGIATRPTSYEKKELKHLTSAPNFPNEVIVLSIFGGSHAVLICGPNKVNIRKFNYVQHQTGRFKNYSPYKHQK